jgi:hypothetical protein
VSSLVSAQVTVNASASGNFFTPTVHGFVQVTRTWDGQNKIITAQLFYELCTPATVEPGRSLTPTFPVPIGSALSASQLHTGKKSAATCPRVSRF